MPDHLIDELRRGATLQSPARNRYFYGKLLDQFHLSMEQRYFNDKRWLLNRLSLGEGVLCGLLVAPSRDRTRILVGPGVAIDGIGREIIVPVESQPIDPRQPTDDCCAPVGNKIEGAGVATICLAYLECETEPVPVLVCGCETEQGCEHGTIRERYCVGVSKGAQKPIGIDAKACDALISARARDKRRRERLCGALSGNCADARDDCVTLATVELKEDGTIGAIDNCGPRVTLYSNAVLLDLILCLADRLDECCGGRVPVEVKSIEKMSGDSQVAAAGTALPAPFVARVSDQNGPVVGEAVTFQVTSGGGSFAGGVPNATVNTIAGGLATAPAFTLGPAAGTNIVHASIAAGTPSSVDFTATGRRVPVRTPPRILRIWPRPGELLDISAQNPQTPDDVVTEWSIAPWLEITFDRAMDDLTRAATKNWLRAGLVRRENVMTGAVSGRVTPVPSTDTPLTGAPQLPGAGVTYRFDFHTNRRRGELTLSQFIVLVRAVNGNIVEAAPGGGAQPLLLDPDFLSVPFGAATVSYDEFWKLVDPARATSPLDQRLGALAMALVAPAQQIAASGTGNGTEGGDFSSWFEVGKV